MQLITCKKTRTCTTKVQERMRETESIESPLHACTRSTLMDLNKDETGLALRLLLLPRHDIRLFCRYFAVCLS